MVWEEIRMLGIRIVIWVSMNLQSEVPVEDRRAGRLCSFVDWRWVVEESEEVLRFCG